jgi:8-amino-3,8-dideoxy-alpha-D-manno-octulosonate transaminase
MSGSKLAIDGGTPAKTTPNPPMYPGGLEIGEEEKREVLDVLDRKYLFRYYGPKGCPSKVRQLEVDFARLTGSRYALATSSCTGALVSSLVACGVGPGDEVIVNGYTFFASAAVVVNIGAVPVIADVDDTLTLDPDSVERLITPRTKAVIAVHMRGAPCDMDRLVALCEKHKLFLIEDVAQACGGSYKGRRLGTFGDIGCFSFQYHKIITAGEGGMVATDDPRLYDRAMGYHDTAACWRPERFAPERYEGELFCGDNYRMSELCGAVLCAQLRKLDGLLFRMRERKRRIKDGIGEISGLAFRRLNDPAGDTAICLIFFLPDRSLTERFAVALAAEGVDAVGIFDKGIPDWHIYAHWEHLLGKKAATPGGGPWADPRYKGKIEYSPDMCPRILDYLSRAVHLNVPPQLTTDDCDRIAEAVRKVASAYL